MSDEYWLERYDRSTLEQRVGVKWSRDGADAIAAWIADMDFPIAPIIAKVLISAIERGDLGYPAEEAERAVRQAFAHRMQRRYGLVVDEEHITVVSDVVQAIYLCISTLTKPGDGVLFFTPSYPPFFAAIAETGRRAITSDLLDRPGGYRIDFPSLTHQIATEGVRALLLCNPHNPTGRAFSADELGELAELCRAHNLFVISDEIHADLVLPGAVHCPIASRDSELAKRTVTLNSASKAFNIAGLRCAVAASGSEELASRVAEIPRRLLGGVSVPGMLAAVTAWNECDGWLEAVIAQLAENRALVTERLSPLDSVHFHPPQATYLAWLDLREAGLGVDPAKILRERARISLSPGSDFGSVGLGHARLNFATPRPILLELLDRLIGALN